MYHPGPYSANFKLAYGGSMFLRNVGSSYKLALFHNPELLPYIIVFIYGTYIATGYAVA
jgi:hypothetical protein